MNKFKIRLVSIDDALLLFDWANDQQTRQNSFNSNPIEWDDHINWLNNKIIDSNSKLYLISENKTPVGLVKFKIDKELIIGVTVAPDHRGKGLSSLIIKKACISFWKSHDQDIFAYIKEENIPSIKAFKKAGFIFFRTEYFNNTNCLILKATKDVS